MSYKDAKGCLPGVANPLDSPPKEIFLHKYDVLEDNHYLHLHVWSAMRLADDDVRYVLAPPEPTIEPYPTQERTPYP